ncbi:Per os infectivity factor 2 [Perigonia lusca single nucleopolyhedrovirus]|uniref:Per os infectivity factor 2 n=1 Tax=Perigonia lusca single nucleopolyhedrovirus TaxID=1675865 RepID=A0A0M3WN88_9ABAC|nr:Per os infectivity factor 2 [Perigonia lusca single nucleopolyhedrovirus]AKN80672.1 Per os infectivity factor 2 [Perigonia lusca single nucleopolyhedrovirus]
MHYVLVVLIVLFIFILYFPMYRAYTIIKDEQTEYNNTVQDRIDYMRNVLNRRRYVPLETLPTIKFDTSLGTINDGELKCMSMPIFVGVSDTPNFDCSIVCDNPAAVYFFVGEYDKFVVNGQMLTRGGYCTTNSVPRNCNRETSVILHSLNSWSCIAEDPRYFAGTHNMVQVAGRQHIDRIAPGQADRNVLYDNLLGRVVDVSRNTFRRNWDELMEDGRRRFEMRCNALDDKGNRMFVNPLNPIECLPNVCTNVNGVHESVKPNFETGECDCGDFNITRVQHIVPDDKTSMCASIVNEFDRDNLSHKFRVECLNLDTPVSQYSAFKLLCPSNVFTQNTDNAFMFVLPGTFPISGNGIYEPTHRLYMDTRSRVSYNFDRTLE